MTRSRRRWLPAAAAAALTVAAVVGYQWNILPGFHHIKYLEGEPDKLPKLDMNLTLAERIENFEMLWRAIDRHYSFFIIKNIDWDEVHRRYRPLVEQASGGEFYRVLHQMVNELKDFHSWLSNYDDPSLLPGYAPEIDVRRVQGRAVATWAASAEAAAGVRPGSVIQEVDGETVAAKVEEIRPRIHLRNSERAFLDAAHRRVLDGEQNTAVEIRFAPPGGEPRTVKLSRTKYRPHHWTKPDFSVWDQETVWSGVHRSGVGYIRILSFRERRPLAIKFDNALAAVRDAPALIVDIRENPGGYGNALPHMIGRLVNAPAPGVIAFWRSGPAHADVQGFPRVIQPTGPWTFARPAALLIDAGTGSAADLFAANFISTGRPIVIGATTHGNVTGRAVEVELPCGLAVRISDGFIADANGRVIEINGNEPQIGAELTIDDVINGTDSVIERAVEELLARVDAARIVGLAPR